VAQTESLHSQVLDTPGNLGNITHFLHTAVRYIMIVTMN